jgi:type I restriction enzyme S subunit
MKFIPLGSIVDIKTGKLDVNAGADDGKYPFFTCASKTYKINEYAFDTEAILIAGNGDLNVKYYNGKFNAYQRTYVLQNKDAKKLCMKYLYYFIDTYMDRLRRDSIGGIIRYIKIGNLTAAEIPLPSLADQIRIAHLLGKVEGLISDRKQNIKQLDELLKSVFLQMFGNPVRNEKVWSIETCDKVVLDISSGTSYGGEDRLFVSEEEIGVLKISAVTRGTFDPTEFKVVNPAQITKPLVFVKTGDFLFSRANTIQLVAACCVVPRDFNQLFLPDKLWVLTLNPELVNKQFFNYLLKNEQYRNVVRSLASGGHDSMLNISMKKFLTLSVPCPPIHLQNKFSVIVEKVKSIESRYQQSLDELEELYISLSQKAFKGELDLARVPMTG